MIARQTDISAPLPPDVDVKPKRRYHVHAALLVYSFVTLLIAIGAFNSQNNLLFWLFGLALGLIVVSGLLSGAMMMGVRIRREVMADAVAGGPLRVRYVVSNRNRFLPAFALTITELVETGNGKASRAQSGRAGRTSRTSSPESPRARLDEEPTGFASHVPARGSTTVEAVALAESRGRVVTRGIRVTTSFPFGVIRKSIEVDAPGGCIVRPAPVELPASMIRNAQGVATGTVPQPRRAGQGDEFLSLRPYTEGDSPRMIAWKRSARSDDLLVRQTAAPAPRRTWVVLDLVGAHSAAQRERAIALAAGAVHLADSMGRAVGLIVPALGLTAGARSGGWHIASLLNDLALIPRGVGSAVIDESTGVQGLSRTEARSAIVIHAGSVEGHAEELGVHVGADLPVGAGA